MDGFDTVGQAAAVAAVHAMLTTRPPHAVLLAGPASVGKHALALDLAAALLCTGASGAARPCRTCRGCRMVEHGNHPDLHLLAPSGAGFQIRIGEDQHPEPGTIRRLASDLALLPVEGGDRVAIIRDAQRMNDVAQSALLKTLEEPPGATTLIVCADDEDLLLPTIRSRCARIRLGTLAPRDVETLLERRGLADAPTAARLARLAGGRPGIAVAYAAAPGAEVTRAEILRTLLDLLGRPRADRLGAARDLLAGAMTIARTLEPPSVPTPDPPRRQGAGRARALPAQAGSADAAGGDENQEPDQGAGLPAGKTSVAERRRGLAQLLEIWLGLARDLTCVQRHATSSIRDVALLEELEEAARCLPAGAAQAMLPRLVRASELLDVNATPELVLDVLLLRWPELDRTP